MGVYVKGVKMPENCYQCKLRGVIDCSPLKGLSPYDAIKICPLVEVKEPHGRLIDADALLKDEWTWFDDFGNYSGEGQLIADAPVIIEATKEE